MPVSEQFLAEFDQEMPLTRTVLERVPDEKFSWKPHPKSGSMAWLAGHIASVPSWLVDTIKLDYFDMCPNGVAMQPPPEPKTRRDLLEVFDKSVTPARAAIAGASDADFFNTWRFLNNGKEVFAMPRIASLRTWVFNHLIHHRGQLTVYLRLNNISVPSIYGPSADEGSL